jgi:hypothetical protein
MKYLQLICLSFVVFLAACANSGNSKAANTSKNNDDAEVVDKDKRSSALSILDYRIKESDGKTFPVVEADIWEYKFVFDGNEMSPPGSYDGQWIDFKADFSYDYGKNSTVEGSGRYHYSLDSSLMLMVDDDENKNPIQYETKFAGDVMVLVGNPEYGPNPYQMKLERVPDATYKQ